MIKDAYSNSYFRKTNWTFVTWLIPRIHSILKNVETLTAKKIRILKDLKLRGTPHLDCGSRLSPTVEGQLFNEMCLVYRIGGNRQCYRN